MKYLKKEKFSMVVFSSSSNVHWGICTWYYIY